jgi:hypothetical protein
VNGKPYNRYAEGVTYVPALPERRPLALSEAPGRGDLLPAALGLAGQGQHTGHARQDDDAVLAAQATLLVATGYAVAGLLITLGLLLLAWMFRWLGGSWPNYVFGGLILWGCVIVVSLLANRRQGLYHSPAGISHHEIDSRERVALAALQMHGELLLKRWEIEEHGYIDGETR